MTVATRALLERVADIARHAGREILALYTAGEAQVSAKADQSPLTRADLNAHNLIVRRLAELDPGIPVLSEEGAAMPFADRSQWRRHWLVDPLDGTKEFLERNGEFTVNIALIEAHAPLLGVVHIPVTDTTYRGLPGTGAWRQKMDARPEAIAVAAKSATPPRVVGSRSHQGDSLRSFLERLGSHRLLSMGSALKFCLIAEGSADVYPRLGPTSEWDTAAAHAVVTGAGGTVCRLDGTPFQYNTRAELLNPHFVAFGPHDHDWLALFNR